MSQRTGKLPPETTFQEVQLKIRDSYRNPQVGNVSQVVLKEGPKAFRIATVFEILDPKTEQFHHYSLRLDHIDRRKGGWFAKPEKSFRCDDDEIEKLVLFLTALDGGRLKGRSGDLHLIDAQDYEHLANILGALDRLPTHDRLELTKRLLTDFSGEGPSLVEFVQAFEHARPDLVSTIAAAARLVEYETAIKKLEDLIQASGTKEQELQEHLEAHPWMFGSEYSELLQRRRWTRDDNLDYMLRRTVDGFLEVVEIKRPISTALFNHDPSHDSYYPAAPLSKVLGQALRYIEEIDRKRDAILAEDSEETLKVRARIIIGRDGDDIQRKCLRSLNSHLSRIEILTFDQLVRIARRVVSVFRTQEVPSQEEETEFPF